MAIAYDTSESSPDHYYGTSSTSHTQAHNNGTGSDRFLVCVTGQGTGKNVTAMTYAGATMELVGTATQSSQNQDMYVLPGNSENTEPATGTNNIIATMSASSDLHLWGSTYTGVDQTTPIDASSNSQTATGDLTYALTSTKEDDWFISGGRNLNAGNMSAGTGTTERTTSATKYFGGGDSNGSLGTTGTENMTWTAASGTSFGMCALIMQVQPAARVLGPSGGISNYSGFGTM
jgi:hypothetical protein